MEVRSSLGDMMAFIENSSGQRRMRQTKYDSSSYDSCATSDLMTSTRAEKVTLMWEINIPWPMHFLFFPLEAWIILHQRGRSLDRIRLCCLGVQSKKPSYDLQH